MPLNNKMKLSIVTILSYSQCRISFRCFQACHVLSGSCTPDIAGRRLWPNKYGYDQVSSSGKRMGNHVPHIEYDLTTPN
jgi:hypothetical protein